jgi:hypothetical protein
MAGCLKNKKNACSSTYQFNLPKLFQGLLLLQINSTPPWCFWLKFQSCLSPRLRPPINNLPKLKLLSSCLMTLSALCCLPGGTSSFFGPSLLHAFYLFLRGLVLFIPDSLSPIFLSEHVVSSSSYAITGITSVPLQRSHCSQYDAMQGHPQSWRQRQ